MQQCSGAARMIADIAEAVSPAFQLGTRSGASLHSVVRKRYLSACGRLASGLKYLKLRSLGNGNRRKGQGTGLQDH